MEYIIDKEKVKAQYRMNDPEKKPTHKTDEKLIVPYNVRPLKEHKDLIKNFEECIGSFCCNLLNCKVSEFNKDMFFTDIINSVEFENEEEKEKFSDIVSTIFFDEGKGIAKFHPKVLIYLIAEEDNVEIGKFLYDVLFNEDEDLRSDVEELFKKKTGNVLADLIIDKLPELEMEDTKKKRKYKNFAKDISEVFNEDFKYLLKCERDFCYEIVTILKFYYLVYILRAVGNLNNMFDVKEIPVIYFTFDWEKVSKGRIGYENGWCLVENAITGLRSHEICLNILNCTNYKEKYTYSEFKKLVSQMNDDERLATWDSIDQVVKMYENAVKDENIYWKEYEFNSDNEDEILFEVERLYGLIYNHHSKVKNAIELSRRYYDWFFEFCRNNFLRNRGRNGMTLNLKEEYVVLLTKLCIKDEEKVRFQYIIKELERRGVYLDKDSRNRLIDFYQRLNVLEKKSDSGDALYVRSIL